MQIEISTNINNVQVFLDEFKTRVLIGSTRKAMNRALSALRTRTNKTLREERKLKASEINNRYLREVKARGSNLATLEAKLRVSPEPVSLIRFLIGNQQSRDQKGIPVSRRKPVRVEIVPGRRAKLTGQAGRGAFIAKGRGGAIHIFRRRGKKSTPIVKQAVGSMASIVSRPGIRTPLEYYALERYGTEFDRVFAVDLVRAADKSGLRKK